MLHIFLFFVLLVTFVISESYSSECSDAVITSPSQLENLRTCQVIQGSLYFLFSYLPSHLSLPRLQEITGSLVITSFQPNPPNQTLAHLLPSLALIRGQPVVPGGFSLVVKDTLLHSLDLPSLRVIGAGRVALINNPVLCHIDSVDWPSLTSQEIFEQGSREHCPDHCSEKCSFRIYKKSYRKYCWSQHLCQNKCDLTCSRSGLSCHMTNTSICCDPECLAGCYGTSSNQCVSCRHFKVGSSCVKACPTHLLEDIATHSCISKETCLSPQRLEKGFIMERSCVSTCPQNYAKDIKNSLCRPCGDNCSKKYCGQVVIFRLQDIDGAKGCYSMEDLHISLREHCSNLSSKMEHAFSSLEVVLGSVRVVKSPSLVSLAFLKNLRLIQGQLPNQDGELKSIFQVTDNPNLRKLWDYRSQVPLVLARGIPLFRMNTNLCKDDILALIGQGMNLTRELSEEERNDIVTLNGRTNACESVNMHLEVVFVDDESAVLIRSNPADIWVREDVVFLIMYKKAANNISLVEDNARCGSNGWITEEFKRCNRKMNTCSSKVNMLSPATRYAIYIETQATAENPQIVTSNLVYFKTRPKNPSPPVNVRGKVLNPHEILVTWQPPAEPNGVITKYVLWYQPLTLNHTDFHIFSPCYHKTTWFISEKAGKTTNNILKPDAMEDDMVTWSADENVSCSCRDCHRRCANAIGNVKQQNDSFKSATGIDYFMRDEIINYVFIQMEMLPAVTNETTFTQNVTKSRSNEAGTMTTSTPPMTTKQPDKTNKNSPWLGRIEVSTKNNQVVLTNLKHYTEYVIHIKACQNPEYTVDDEFDMRVEPALLLCSNAALLHTRTSAIEKLDILSADDIAVSVMESFGVKVIWRSPISPNGILLNYVLRYRPIVKDPKIESKWSSRCVSIHEWMKNQINASLVKLVVANQSTVFPANQKLDRAKRSVSSTAKESKFDTFGWVVVSDLRSGEYELQISAVSLAGNGDWSDTLQFVIQGTSEISWFKWWWVLLVCILIGGVLACIVSYIVYHERQKHLRLNTWVSPNPGYWNIENIDEWETPEENIDIDFSHPLGKGSFGVVYKGRLKKITSPSAHFYSNPCNISVAVKTVTLTCTEYDRWEFLNEACHMTRLQSWHLVRLLGIVFGSSAIPPPPISTHPPSPAIPPSSVARLPESFILPDSVVKDSSVVMETENDPSSNEDPMEKDSLVKSATLEHKKSEVLATSQILKSVQSLLSSSARNPTANLYSRTVRPMVLMELMELGDLSCYLRNVGLHDEGTVSDKQALLWANQIADGMAFLAHTKYVHRDLAARNILVNRQLIAKIGDFGLARDINEQEYYRKTSRGKLPVRWMAPEALKCGYSTMRTDIWSYGIVLWEICTLSALPYQGLSHEEVMQYIISGNTLLTNDASVKYNPVLRELMVKCWQYKAKLRPTFLQILRYLEPYGDSKFKAESFVHLSGQLNTSWEKQEESCFLTTHDTSSNSHLPRQSVVYNSIIVSHSDEIIS